MTFLAAVDPGIPVSTFLAALGSIFSLLGVFWYVSVTRQGRRSQALTETEQLAEARGDRIADLTSQVEDLVGQLASANSRIVELEQRMDTFKAEVERERLRLLDDMADARHMLVRGVRGLLQGVLEDLQQTPPDATSAIGRISEWITEHTPPRGL